MPFFADDKESAAWRLEIDFARKDAD